jgi:histone deacetylase 1/2
MRSLLYITVTRPDIAFSVGVCARFHSNPKESHLATVKRILKYLSVISDYGIWYSKYLNLSLVNYLNVDWASNVDDRKSTMRGCFYVGEN